jgi:hypothetical protein
MKKLLIPKYKILVLNYEIKKLISMRNEWLRRTTRKEEFKGKLFFKEMIKTSIRQIKGRNGLKKHLRSKSL